MKWISIESEGWAGTFVAIRSSEVVGVERYYGYTKKEAEQHYRQKYGLIGKRLRRIDG